ncbi:MAG TPA: response regulator [Chloroflexota bacterium]|nr:response regulator [Chloroflexota bacterium]HUM67367.1 response regulator [Chloroflexota bacterium]
MTRSQILIVDDDPISRETLTDILQGQNCEILTEAHGQAGLERAQAVLPDLILLDVMMPGLDGFGVCKELRRNPLTAEIPILLITALDDQESRLCGIEAGADDFLTKPYHIVELQARVRTILRLNRYRQLLNERAKFEQVVEHASMGYLIINERDEILFANDMAYQYLQLPEYHDPGTSPPRFWDVATKAYRLMMSGSWDSWPAPTQPGHTRYLTQPENGSAKSFWLGIHTLARLPDPDGDKWVLGLTDATEQVRLQQEVRAFHILVQHKLRTPLMILLPGLALLKKRLNDHSDASCLDLLDAVHKKAEQLHQEVERISNFADAIHNSQLSGAAYFPVRKLRALIVWLAAEMGMDSPVVSFEGNLANNSLQLPLSAEVLGKLFRELLDNARKFHPERTPQITVRVVSAAQYMRIVIMDDGIHLSPAQLANAWRPYYQGEKYFTGNVTGLGVGLPMVESLVHRVNGRCQIRNRPDAPGVIVEIRLPTASVSRVPEFDESVTSHSHH